MLFDKGQESSIFTLNFPLKKCIFALRKIECQVKLNEQK